MYISPPMLHNGSDKPRVSLSCRQCQQRKKKCDKNQPCQSCTQYGIECVPISRARLPRGRHASKQNSADLRQRVARLESLTAIPVDFSQPVKHNTSAKNSVETLDSAWSAISEEVLGIRELLDRDSPNPELDFASPGTRPAPQSEAESFDILIYGDASCCVEPSLLAPPSKAVVFALLDIYMHRIDPILKVIHGPSLRMLLLESSGGEPAIQALKSAIFFTALCTLEEQECVDIVGEAKSKTATKFQVATELSLSKAKLLTARNLTVLQAFVIYLVSTSTQSSALFDYIGWNPSEPRSAVSLGTDPYSVDEFARLVRDKYTPFCKDAVPFQRFTRVVAEDMVITLRFLSRRPTHRFYSSGPPPKDDFDILDVALSVLERALQKYTNDGFKPWKWFAWPKWYALAVLLAELCEHKSGPKVDKAWAIAEACFADYGLRVGDSALWAALRKLMHMARTSKALANEDRSKADGSRSRMPLHTTETEDQSRNSDVMDYHTTDIELATIEESQRGSFPSSASEEMDMLSWVNWEAFMEDIANTTELDALNDPFQQPLSFPTT
ncbi:MAG: hypothetical protein OHK93_005663 [Ramalina farinacea]|uniref:Zn(2)-C6 fungal-type domain-containing protein n=1 Tax=Ramalina farinacea TaxID=258253 RepID=A0AA43TTR0_9LECA|nr:hypothetical protein [Ramalina farinacea]